MPDGVAIGAVATAAAATAPPASPPPPPPAIAALRLRDRSRRCAGTPPLSSVIAPSSDVLAADGRGRLGRGLGGRVGGRRLGRRVVAAVATEAELLAPFGAALQQVFGDFSHWSIPSPAYSGPLMPPSLRTRQKWIAMKMTMTNGSRSTCSVYQRSSVSPEISFEPSSAYRIWPPKTGV